MALLECKYSTLKYEKVVNFLPKFQTLGSNIEI